MSLCGPGEGTGVEKSLLALTHIDLKKISGGNLVLWYAGVRRFPSSSGLGAKFAAKRCSSGYFAFLFCNLIILLYYTK